MEMRGRYLEDFAVGQTFGSGRARIDAARIKAFASEFDPQPFHLDEEAAHTSIFRGLAASGWHTAAIVMRLIVESDLRPAGGTIGVGAAAKADPGLAHNIREQIATITHHAWRR